MAKKLKSPASEAAEQAASDGSRQPDYTPAKDPGAAERAGIRKAGYGEHACCLVSRMDQPMTISYEGKAMVLSPRAGSKHPCVIEDSRLLGALPKGVFKVPLPAHLRAK
jgi:hypothetical protein